MPFDGDERDWDPWRRYPLYSIREIGRRRVNRRWQLNVFDPDGTRVEFMEPWTVK